MSKKIALVGSRLAAKDGEVAFDLRSQLLRLGRQSLAVTLSLLLFLQPAIANAQSVSAAGSAPAANQPSVGAAPNGVPLIDIVTPNAAGLSHNKYDNFNVGTQGLILNNFKGEQGTSNLGGVTPGNPNLNASNPASVILNEVTSGNRSALNGPTEVFGGRADVIIANQNGVTCNGCGFINTPHATLTTGVPNIGADGSLTGFTVNGGDVTFEGTGGNFAAAPGAVDLFDVVSRQIHVNAPVYGKTIRLTGGASQYNYATGESTALTATSGTPEYAIDGTALGAMQADRIKVVVTEKGAGVKMSGDMAANADELSLSADGKISIGNVSGNQGVSIKSKQTVTAAKVTSKAKVAIQADQGVTLQTVAADSDIVLSSGAGLLSVSGDVNSATTVQMSSDGGIVAGSVTAGSGGASLSTTVGDIAIAGVTTSAGSLNLTATSGAISAASLQSSQNIAVNAALDIAVAGNVQAQGNVSAAGRSISAGKVISGIDIAATSADPRGNVVLGTAGGDLGLTATAGNIATGNLVSAGSLNASATGNVTAGNIQSTNGLKIAAASLAASSVTSHGALAVNTASGRVDVSGQILAASNVLISGSALQASAIAAGVDFAATNANGGSIVLGPSGTLGLTATAGNIVADKLLSAGDLTVNAALLQANNITSHGAVGVVGGVNVANQLLSSGNTTINGNAYGVSVGLIASGVDFAATKAAGGNIVLAGSGDLTINDSAGAIQAGTVLAAGAINATGQTITVDTITGQKDITLSGATSATAGSGGVKVTSQILGGGNVGIIGSSIAADAIVSGVDIAATDAAGGRITLGPTIAGTGNLTLTAAGAISAGTLLSSSDLIANGATITAGNISAHHDMTLGGVIGVSGQILGAGNVLVSGQSLSAQTIVAGLDFGATNAAGGNIVLGQTGDLKVATSGVVTVPTVQAAGTVDIRAASVASDAMTGHKDITVSAVSGPVNVTNQVLGGGNINLVGSAINASAIISGIDFARTAAANGQIVQTTSGDLTLASTGNINAGTLLSAGRLGAAGTTVTAIAMTAHGDMTLAGAINVNSQILSSGNVLISGQSLSVQTLVAGIDFSGTNAAGGNIVLGQTGDLTVATSGVVTAPTIQAAGTTDIRAAAVTSDAITGHKDITVADTSGPVDITNQVLGGGNINLSGSAIKAGAIISGVDFTRTAAANGHIVQTASGDISLTSPGAISAATLLSAGNLHASGSAVTADGVTAHGDVTLGGAISVTDQILGSGNVSITGQSLSAQTVVAGIDLDATNRAGGNIVLGQSGNLAISVGGTLATPTMQAAGSINAGGAIINANAVTGHGNITLSGSTTVTSQVLGGGNIAISGPGIKVGTVVSGVDFARTAAANGNIVLTASGDLTLASTGSINAGTLLSAGKLNASGSTIAADGVTAHGDVTLDGATSVAGQILGSGNISITGQSLSAQMLVSGIDFDATNAAGGNIVLGQTGDLTVAVNGAVAAPTIQAAGAIDVGGASVTAASITGHKDISLSGTAVGGVNIANQVLGGGNIGISGTSIQAGTIVSGVDFAATAAANGNIVQTTSGNLTLASTGAINAGTLLSAGALSAGGSTVNADAVTAHGDVTLNGATSIAGQILGAGNVLITGQSLSAQTVGAGIDFDATNRAGSNIVVGTTGELTAQLSGGFSASTIQAAGAVNVNAATVTADTVTGHEDITLSGITTVNHQILGGGNVGISGSSIKAGTIVSGVDFAATAAANGNIVQTTSGSLTLASTGGINTGTLLSAGSFSASGATVTADAATARGDITLNGATSIAGQVLGAGNILITGQSLEAQTIVAGIDFDATNRAGDNIVLGQTGDLTTQLSGGFSASTIQAAGDIDVNAATVTADTVTGHKDIALAGATTVNGQILGGGTVSASGPSIAAGAIVSGVDFAATAVANGNIVQTSTGDISLTSTGGLTVGTLLSAGDLTAQATDLTASSITSHGKTNLKASGTAASGRVNVSGQILSASELTINANSLNTGLLVSGVDFTATSRARGNIVLGPSGAMNLTVVDNAAAGTILSAGDFTANAGNLQASSITSHGKVGVVGNVDVSNQILAAGDLAIKGGSISAPTLISGIDFAATNAAGGNIVLASSGAMNLTASGNITVGTILSAGDLAARATNLAAASITSHGKVDIFGSLAATNQVISAGDLTFSGGSINAPILISGVDFAATSARGGGIVLGTAGDINLTASAGITAQTMLSAGAIAASGSAIAANAVTGHGDITLAGGNSVNVTGQLLSAGDVLLSGSSVQLGQAVTGVDFATTARSSNGAIALGPSGDLTINAGSASASMLIVAGNLNVAASAFTGGNITGHGAVAIGSSTSPGAVRINGQLLGASNVSMTGSAVSGNVIAAGVDFAAMDQSGAGNVILGSAGNLTLAATAGDISFNSLLAAGTITANAANNISANAVAHGDLALAAGNAITLTGQSLGTGNINLNARSMTIDTLVSGVDFAATNAAAGGSLMLQRSGTMTLAASNGSINANSLLSGGNLAASATQNIGYSSLQSLGNATLTAPGAIAYTSTTRVGGNLTLNTGALDLSGTRGSRIAGGGTLIVNASLANLSGSNLVFGGLALNLSGSADLSNAQVSTVTNAGGSGDISISAAGLTTNANTALLAAHDLTLSLPSLANTGQLAAGNSLTFNISGDFYNSPSGLVFAGNNANLFVGGILTNDQGAILSGTGLTMAGPGGGQRNGAVVNSAGLIQSGGSMSILTNTLINTKTSAPAIQRNVQISNAVLSAYDLITRTYECQTRCGTGSGQHEPTYGWTETIDQLVTQIVSEDQLISGAGASAKIRAGRDLTIDATNLRNAYSSIKSDGNMLLTVAGTLTNDGATLNRITQTVCDSSTPCQYYPDVVSSDTTQGGPDCSGPNRPCIGGGDPALTYSDNPNGTRDPSKDLAAGTTVSVQAIGVLSGVIQARGALNVSAGAVNNVASNGSIAGQVVIDAAATTNNPLGALNSMTAGGALFNVNAALTGVVANSGATAGSGPTLTSGGPTIGSGPAINGNSLAIAGATSIGGNSLTVAGGASVNGSNLTAGGASISGGSLTAAAGASVGGNGVTAATGPSIGSNTLTAGSASINPNSLMGKLTAAIGNSGNLTQILQTNGAQLAAVAKPQSGGVGGTVPGQVFLFETRAAFLDVSKFYGSGYFIDRIGYTPETKVPFLGDAYFDNQLVDEQMRQLVGNGLGAGSFVPGDNATDQMKSLLDNGVAYAEAHGLALGQALTPEQAANLTESMVIYQAEVVDGASVLVPVVYLSAADRAKTTSAATMSGNTVSIDAGSVDNSGAIAAADGMTINATDIKANGGAFLAGGNMNLNAENGITLAAQTMSIGGQTVVAANGGVTAGGNLKMDAGAGSLMLSGTKVAAGGSAQLSGQTVTIGAVKQDNGGVQTLVGTTVTTGGNLSIAGASGVNIIASSAKVGGDLSVLSSNGSVSIISAGVDNTVLGKDRLNLSQGGTITTTTSQIQQGSSLTSGGTTLISGSQGVLIGGSSLVAGGNLGIVSTNGNIAITASQDQTTSQSKTIAGAANGYKGGQSSSTSVTSNASSITSQNGNVTVQADTGNISVIGSDVNAMGGTANLIAKGDVTIGEATNSASSSSKSGSKKSTDATTTAEGSSISGQTGVDIASSSGNVTISASDVTAGDATHTANANLQAAGNIVIASGKDTDETTSDSKKSGFLSSSKTHTHTYDEDTVGSSISASGNITVNAGGEAVVSGSEIAAGNGLSLSGSTVTVMGAEEEHESDKQTKKSGIGVGSGGGFISIYGSHDKTISESSSDNIGSTLSAANGNITLNATKGDLNIIGSSISATNGDVTGKATGDINILPGHESDDTSKSDKRSGFGIQVSTNGGGASIGIGVGRFTDQVNQSADTNAVSTIKAGGDINLTAGNTFNDQAGQITAGGGVTIFGQNGVNILSGNDITNFDEVATSFFAGVSVGVSSSFVGAGQSIENLASKLGKVTDGYSAANVAFAGMQAYDALSSLKNGINAGNLASVSLTAGFSYSKNETSVSTSTPVLPTISGSSVDISTNGDFTSRGLQISATANPDHADDPMNGSVLISANNIDMAGAQATSNASSSSQSAGASIGVSVGVGMGGATGITPTASVSAGQSKSSSSSTTQVISTVSATDNITFISKGDTTLNNTVFSADTINGKVGGNLNIVSTPNTGSQSNSSSSLGFSFTGPTVGSTAGQDLLTAGNVGTALGGLTLGGVQPGFGSGKGSTNWIDTPAGLYSTGDQNITVGGNTNLAASGLISTDGQVNLDTGTLTWSDFVGTQKYQGYEVNANIDLYSGADANGKTRNNSSASGKYQLDDVEQSVKATISSGGAAGNITVRNPDQQASLEQRGQTRPVTEINTDPTKQNVITKDKHIDLEPYVSVQSLSAAVSAGKTVLQAIGDALDKMVADRQMSSGDGQTARNILLNLKDPQLRAALISCAQQGAGTACSGVDAAYGAVSSDLAQKILGIVGPGSKLIVTSEEDKVLVIQMGQAAGEEEESESEADRILQMYGPIGKGIQGSLADDVGPYGNLKGGPTIRPTPRQSELDVGDDLGEGYTPQVSYINGQQVPYGTSGSVRPDFIADDGSAAFEVKNFNITTNSDGLINNVAKQAVQRSVNLPQGMQQQLVIDTRGQTVTPEQELAIRQAIVERTNGIISPNAIRFKTK
ncbi:Haemagluttinin repeat-containing protein [Rhizobium lusitanum]|uniref:Haemagluttinin repeat-containing protein n=2 Tax=Rhizobium lusitanum TaxID=293958 RepID=A0A1C3XHC6_9HYPH|nr:hemagglutinin repeat-containing protein [Rhizobium lusitanum]SCB51384.1 Haemagluttinin repeat-containing protein [Rhizobium lusitanum]